MGESGERCMPATPLCSPVSDKKFDYDNLVATKNAASAIDQSIRRALACGDGCFSSGEDICRAVEASFIFSSKHLKSFQENATNDAMPVSNNLEPPLPLSQ